MHFTFMLLDVRKKSDTDTVDLQFGFLLPCFITFITLFCLYWRLILYVISLGQVMATVYLCVQCLCVVFVFGI